MLWISASAAFALGDSVDFQSSVYVSGQGVVGVDNWQLYPNQILIGGPAPFVIQTSGTNKYLNCKPNPVQSYGVARPFLPTGGVDYVDVQWRWMAENAAVNLCAGLASQAGAQGAATPKATVCMEAGGTMTAARGTGTAVNSSTNKWVSGTWYYTKIRFDDGKGVYSVYLSTDSSTLTDSANLLFSAVAQQGDSGQKVYTFFLSAANSTNSYGVDVDDILWIGARDNTWIGNGTGTNPDSWYNGGNWSLGSVPDSNDVAVFSPVLRTYPNSNRVCNLNYPGGSVARARVFGVSVAPNYTDTLNLESDTLTVILAASFNGGYYKANGGCVRFVYPTLQSLVDTTAVLAPPVLQAGPGLLSLVGSGTVAFAGYQQTGGGLNLNGTNVTIDGNLVVSGAVNPVYPGVSGLYGLGNRTITVPNGTVQFLGTDSDLSLTSANPWNLKVGGTVYANNAVIRNSHLQSTTSTPALGNAVFSVDSGGNQGWAFWAVPAIVKQPKAESLLVGSQAQFTITATPVDSVQYQWQRDSAGKYVDINGATTDTLKINGVALKDDTLYRCRLWNLADTLLSNHVLLAVRFPAPAANQPSGNFQDSIAVKLQDSVAAASLYYSLNHAASAALKSGDSVTIRATDTLSAFAVLGNDTSARVTYTYTKVASGAKAAIPVAAPTGGSFPDTFSVVLSSATPGAGIRYTTDGSAVTPTSSVYQMPLPIRSNTTLKAVAYDPPNLSPSDTLMQVYTLLASTDSLAPPWMSAVPGLVFSDSVVVTLSASEAAPNIFYRVNGGALIKYPAVPIVLKATSTLTASLVSGNQASRDTTWTFTRGLAAPIFSPPGQSFPDTQRVALSLASGTTGSIYYTITGKDPDSTSTVYKGSLLLDSSTEIRALVLQGSLSSAVHSETYYLTPDTPQVSPSAGRYFDSVAVSLRSVSSQAHIYYTTDGSMPNPGTNGILYAGPFTLQSNAVIKAIAVAGQGSFLRQSPVRVAAYTISSIDSLVLNPEDTVNFLNGYQIRNLSTSVAATVVQLSMDSLKDTGFADVRFIVNISTASGAAPSLQLLAAKDSLGLYSIQGGLVRYLGTAAGGEIHADGEYFVGLDTLPPTISSPQETILANDSTQIKFVIEDNVVNLTLTANRSDQTGAAVDSISAPFAYSPSLKNPAGSFQALTLRFQVGDGRNVSTFPAPPAKTYALSQSLAGGAGPKVWSVGQEASRPWDFIGLPFAATSSLTLQSLRSLNNLPQLTGMVYDPTAATGYRALDGDEAWPAGQALWLANNQPLSNLIFPALNTAALGTQSMMVDLKPGWNSICSQRFDTLFWPVKRGANYSLSSIKGLWSYFNTRDSDGYQAADSLLPWRGYWVYNAGGQDTAVNLSATALPKVTAQEFPLEISLLPNRGIPLFLGADAGFSDGIGREDEPMPPLPSGGPSAALLRDGQTLMTDQIHFLSGAALQWKLALDSRTEKNGGAARLRPDSTQWILPDGYEVWAVSKLRGLRFQLDSDSGSTLASPAGFSDTLTIYAAPHSWVAANLGSIPTQANALSHRLVARAGGLELDLEWPGDGLLGTAVYDLRGRKLTARNQMLPAGYYRLFLDLPKVSGMLLLRFTGEINGQPLQWTDRVLP